MLSLIVLIIITVLTALVSLAGGFLLLSRSKLAQLLQKFGTIFAAIVLTYTALFHLIPEALEGGTLSAIQVFTLVGVGLLVCLVTGAIAGRFHQHGDSIHFHHRRQAIAMIIVDCLHTIIDGLVIGTSFVAGLGTGIFAAIATTAHEVPQEIGDFALMLRSRIPKKSIIKIQIITSLLLLPAALVAYFVGEHFLPLLPALLALIAGFFIYIVLGELWGLIKFLLPKFPRPKATTNKESHHD